MDNDNICLIGKENIINKIKLPCNHIYEYINLYNEIKAQHKIPLKSYIFECPYCRHKYDFTLPYYQIDNIEENVNINYNQDKTLKIYKCELCDKAGHLFKIGTFCFSCHRNKVGINTCEAICKNGVRCKNKLKDKEKSIYCGIHININK